MYVKVCVWVRWPTGKQVNDWSGRLPTLYMCAYVDAARVVVYMN